MDGLIKFMLDAVYNYSEHSRQAESNAKELFDSDSSLSDLQKNQKKQAFAHAYTAAMITVEAGRPLARAAGDIRELKTTKKYYDGGPDFRTDTYRDLYNNEVGYEIGVYARENDLNPEQVQSLVVEAMEHGDLIESIHRANPDPRLPSYISDIPGQNGFIVPVGPYNGFPSTFHANAVAPFWRGPNRAPSSQNGDNGSPQSPETPNNPSPP